MIPKKLKEGMKFRLNRETDKTDWEMINDDMETYYREVYVMGFISDDEQNIHLNNSKGTGWGMDSSFLRTHFIHIDGKINDWKKIVMG